MAVTCLNDAVTGGFACKFQTSAVATGNGTPFNVGGLSLVIVQVTGITTAQVTFEGALDYDSPSYVSIPATNMTTGVTNTFTHANGLFCIHTNVVQWVRCRISSWTAGTITIIGKASDRVADQFQFALAPATATSTAQEASRVISAAPARLFLLTGYNAGAVQFIQVHNAAALPADTAIPIESFRVAGLSNFSLDIGREGENYTTGIVVCNSSTQATKTIGGADTWFRARYGAL